MVNFLWCNFHDLGSISSKSNEVKCHEFSNSDVELHIAYYLVICYTVIWIPNRL